MQLKNIGVTTDSWQTLQGVCKQLLFSNEASIWISPLYAQFYLESSTGTLFVRYSSPNESLHSSGERVFVGYIKDDNTTEKKEVYPYRGGVVDKKIGRYHDVYEIEEISCAI